MNGWRLLALLVVLSLTARPAAADPTNTLARGVSITHQFVAYAPDELLPHAICVFAEQVKREWNNLLDQSAPWRDPIVILVDQQPAGGERSPSLSVAITDLHLKYQITWLVPPALEHQRFLQILLEALAAELANRDEVVVRHRPYQTAPIPAWLVTGLARSIQGRDERLMQAARRSLDGGHPQTAFDLLTATPAESTTGDELFEANAWMFTEALLGLPQGRLKLRNYLGALGSTKSVTNAFWKVYGAEFADEKAVERWWALQLTSRTATVVAQNLTAAETARRLAGILATQLTVTTSTGQGEQLAVPLQELGRYADQAWLPPAIADKRQRLEILHSQAGPTLRPAIARYLEALDWLQARQLPRYRRAVALADKTRAAAVVQAEQITAYLDEAEAQHNPVDLRAGFQSLFETLAKVERLEKRRRNPISDYLDAFDR